MIPIYVLSRYVGLYLVSEACLQLEINTGES